MGMTTNSAQQQNTDPESFKRRLSETLVPKLREVQQLSAEMFPGQSFSFDVDAPQLRQWHPSVEADMSGTSETPHTERRRLAEASTGIEQGVQVQARTLFTSLHQELGEQMPEAPARMLTSSEGDSSFMTCVMKAVPNPANVVQCIVNNMSDVVEMVTSFMKGKR